MPARSSIASRPTPTYQRVPVWLPSSDYEADWFLYYAFENDRLNALGIHVVFHIYSTTYEEWLAYRHEIMWLEQQQQQPQQRRQILGLEEDEEGEGGDEDEGKEDEGEDAGGELEVEIDTIV
ncbi:hypothetical protein M011DRAFT_457396 [Sporormia fimetaria CBS 119925]|uniref:Uncharacterized protein n=1 Tax=Sporormia fimetaria CBS 119925 TaxID=1340428 RepID=A0A6A6VHT1_9PLEO|nr:hypothetical protein M011DRAFT_457396 [Sporormia fimetaria CBS 119925]